MGAHEDGDAFDFYRVLLRGWMRIVLCAAIAVLGAALYLVALSEPTYTAKAAVVLEESGREVIEFGDIVSGAGSSEEKVNTEIEILRSRGLARRLVEEQSLIDDPEFNRALQGDGLFRVEDALAFAKGRLGLGKRAADSENEILSWTIDSLLDAISIRNVPNSNILMVGVESSSPGKAAKLANALVDLYTRYQLETKFKATSSAMGWLGDRVAELKVQLEAAEQELKAFTAAAELVSAETLDQLGIRLKDLRQRLDDIRAGNAATAAEIGVLTSAKGAEARLEQGRQKAAAVERAIEELEDRIRQQSSELLRQQQLGREVEASRAIYEFSLGRLKELSVQRGIQQADARLLSEAEVPVDPSAPKGKVILAVSLALGLFAGCGLVLASASGSEVFRTADELERNLSLTVAAEIPVLEGRRRDGVLATVLSDRVSPYSEAIRNLRTSIQMAHGCELPKVIMLSSSLPGEGKTVQSLALARSIASIGKKVLLVDADLRHRGLSRLLGHAKERGLSAAIAGEADARELVIRHDAIGCDLLVADACDRNPADLFTSNGLSVLVEDLAATYDVIVIDTPPVLLVPDARLIATAADAIYLLVRWDGTTRRDVASAVGEFQAGQIPVSGLVLTQIDGRGMRRYGYGGRRGDRGYGSSYYRA